MILLVLFFIISLLPGIFLYIWLRNYKKEDVEYKNICISAFKRGLFLSTSCALLITSIFAIFQIVFKLIGLSELQILIYHKVIAIALSEELSKFIVFRHVVKKYKYSYTPLDLISLIMIVGLGFQILEACFYAVGADIPTMLTRGITIMHGGYAFITGYFIAKGMKSNNKFTCCLGFIIAVILHGAYDFFLSPLISDINPDLAIISLALAFISIVTMIIAIIYIRKVRKNSEFNIPLNLENTIFQYKEK